MLRLFDSNMLLPQQSAWSGELVSQGSPSIGVFSETAGGAQAGQALVIFLGSSSYCCAAVPRQTLSCSCSLSGFVMCWICTFLRFLVFSSSIICLIPQMPQQTNLVFNITADA